MNTDRNRKLPRLIVAVCVAALAVWIVLMVVLLGDRDGKNDKPAEEKETQLSPTAEPTVTPEQEIRVPEGSVLVWRLAEYSSQGNSKKSAEKTVYEYNEAGQCVTAIRYNSDGAATERYHFQYTTEKSEETGEPVSRTVVSVVSNPESGADVLKHATVTEYEGKLPVSVAEGETTDAAELKDFTMSKVTYYTYDENGCCTVIEKYAAMASEELKLTSREYAVNHDDSDIREWWTENYSGVNLISKDGRFSDSFCSIGRLYHGYFEEIGSYDLRIVRQAEIGNSVLYYFCEGDALMDAVEITYGEDGSRTYAYTYHDNVDHPRVNLIKTYDADGHPTVTDYFNYRGKLQEQKTWEYEDGRLTRWSLRWLEDGSLEDGRTVRYDSEGRIVEVSTVSEGRWKVVFNAEFDRRGDLIRRVTPEGEETFSREYDDNGNCVEYTQKTPSRHYGETMTYAPMVITEEALESAEQYYYPLSDVFPKAMQEYTEPDVEQE